MKQATRNPVWNIPANKALHENYKKAARDEGRQPQGFVRMPKGRFPSRSDGAEAGIVAGGLQPRGHA